MTTHRQLPPMPLGERSRLDALRRYQVLDTPPEEVFDRITRLAARIFGTPISLVSLLDEHRQWFKSRHGFDPEWTHRELAFCSYTILEDEPMVVEDAALDPRFTDNPLVAGAPSIRFYAGAQLRTFDGHAIGTLCVVDRQPRRDFDEEDCAILRDLAQFVMLELESRNAVMALRDEVAGHLRTQERLRRSIIERDVLLREVHHRVKNNLQAVAALLQVERTRLLHLPAAAERLDAVAMRIVLLGQVHDQIYASGECDRIDMRRQLEILADDLGGSDPGSRAVIDLRAEPLACDLDTGVPLKLIANELIGNCLKHAFPSGRGRIEVTLSRDALGNVVLGVRDDGVGVAAGSVPGIGSLLVGELARQIDATVSVATDAGVTATVVIPARRFLPG